MISNLVFWGAGLAIITSTNQNSCYSPSRFCQIMRISWLPFIIFPEIIPLSMNKLTTRNDCFEKKESPDWETICQVYRFAFWSRLLGMQRLWIPVDLKRDKISTRVAVCQQANAVQINKSHDKLNSSPKNVSKKILRNYAQCLQSFCHKTLHLKTNSDVDNHNLADLTPHLQCCPTVLQVWVCNYSLETALWQTEMSTRDLDVRTPEGHMTAYQIGK